MFVVSHSCAGTGTKLSYTRKHSRKLANCTCFIMNKFERVWVVGGGVPCTVRSKLIKFEHIGGGGVGDAGGGVPCTEGGWGGVCMVRFTAS